MGAPEEQPELLVAAESRSTVAALLGALADLGIEADVAHGLDQAREAFLARGGHQLLLLGPDLTPGAAGKLVDALTTVDPDLPVAVFGDELLRDQRTTRRARRIRYHPSSRAAVGAVLKALRER